MLRLQIDLDAGILSLALVRGSERFADSRGWFSLLRASRQKFITGGVRQYPIVCTITGGIYPIGRYHRRCLLLFRMWF
jgi:hypothetical protein